MMPVTYMERQRERRRRDEERKWWWWDRTTYLLSRFNESQMR
jgi:hypothetical protein